MTPERYRKIGELCQAAVPLPDADRTAFLDMACGADRELRRQVEARLAAHERVDESVDANRGTLPATSTIGRYQILSLLGRGGMGEVYLAHDPTLGRKVAVKLLRVQFTGSRQALLRFEHEARAASSLNHPNIVTVYEIGQFGDGRFIAMEVVEGRPLSAITGQAMPLTTLLPIARQLAQALAVAHAAGIVHRDIKPENIMVRPDGYVKVLDFGVARLLSGHLAEGGDEATVTVPGVLIGTPRYMSPEQIRGEPATPASDVFALGTVLYELGTGWRFASGRTTTSEQADQSRAPTRASQWAPDIPQTVQQLILRMLDSDPARRPSAQRVYTELALTGGSVSPHDVGSVEALEERSQMRGVRRQLHSRSRWLLPAVAGLMFVIVLIAAYSRWLTTSPPGSTEAGGARGQLKVTQITANPATRRVISMALSPDGRYAAYSDWRGIHVRAIDTADSQLLPDTSGMGVREWSADGTRIFATKSGGGGLPEQWSISLLGRREPMQFGYVSPDGTRTLNLSRGYLTVRARPSPDNGTSIDSDTREVRIDLGAHTVIWGVAWSPSGRWLLAAIVTPTDAAQNRGRIERVDPVTGNRDVLLRADQTGPVRSLAVSRAGVIFYGQGRTGIWAMAFDESTGTRRGEPRRITPSWNDVEVAGIDISADGKRLLYLRPERRQEVHVGRLAQSGTALDTLERLPVMDLGSDVPSSWALDSRSIYLSSSRSGDQDIYRQGIGEQQADLVVGGAGQQCCAQPTPDGKWILYRTVVSDKENEVSPTLRRLPVGGVLEEEVLATSGVSRHRCGFQSRCVVTFIENNRVAVYDLDWITGKRTKVTVLPASTSEDLDVSRDGRQLAFLVYATPGDAGRTIRILDIGSEQWRDVSVNEAIRLRSVSWASDGRGLWAVGLTTSEDTRVYYVPLSGDPVVLSGASGILPTWVLPSPDGSRLAFFSHTITSNVWMLEDFDRDQ